MKQIFLRSLTIVALALSLTLPALADTVRLKDGSVIRGQIVSFKNEQFTILVGSGARGRKSRITVYMEDVDSIEFDSAGSTGTAEDTNTNTSQPTYQPPANTQMHASLLKAIAYPSQGDYPRRAAGNFDFFSQQVDVHLDDVRAGIARLLPHVQHTPQSPADFRQ